MSYVLKLLAVFFCLRCHLSNNWYDCWTGSNTESATLRTLSVIFAHYMDLRTLVGLLYAQYGTIAPSI